jgi:hypothetical protein
LRHTIRQYDRRRSISAILKNPNGTVCDLTDADRVTFTMVRAGDKVVKIDDEDCVIVDDAAGSVRYDWADGDTDWAGEFHGWFRVYWDAADDTDVETFPNGENEQIYIFVTYSKIPA